VGENGAGKSTTINLILNLIKKDSGSIKLLGEELDDKNKNLCESIGVVLDECNFPENLTLNEVSTVVANIYKTWDKTAFENYRKKFNLSPDKKVKDFSRGMKMKLSIAVALSHNSRLLILDEATSGLDPMVRDEILDIFLEFIQDETHSIFISSHIITDLEKICDYITFIHKGKIVFSENKDDILEKYGVLKCSIDEFESIDKNIVLGVNKTSVGVSALVEKAKAPKNMLLDNAGIEDIMVFISKGDN
ncbi:MAG: ABC transporter ATP-binding protein, partial [Oscillospiraceae bacterium]